MPSGLRPAVTVVVPAFNEEKVIVKTVDAVLRSELRRLVASWSWMTAPATTPTANAVPLDGDHPRVRVFANPTKASRRR